VLNTTLLPNQSDSLGISIRPSPIIARPSVGTTEVPTTVGMTNSVSPGQNSPTSTIATPSGSNMGVSAAGQMTPESTTAITAVTAPGQRAVPVSWRSLTTVDWILVGVIGYVLYKSR
jgi:hypothetical protein